MAQSGAGRMGGMSDFAVTFHHQPKRDSRGGLAVPLAGWQASLTLPCDGAEVVSTFATGIPSRAFDQSTSLVRRG